MKKTFFVGMAFLSLIFIPQFLLGAADPSFNLRCAQPSAVTSPNQPGLELMAKLAAEKTNGQVQIKIFGGGVLGGERDQNEGVQMGTIDMGFTSVGVFATFVPTVNVLNLPFLFENIEHFKKFRNSKVAENLLATFEEKGFKGLGFCIPTFREPLNRVRSINKPEDFKGLKIRLMEVPIHMATYSAMGASPTAMAYGEVYSAMQLGVVDGCENSPAFLLSQRFFEVSKYLSRLPVFSNACLLMMNLDKWKKLSPNQQKALRESAEKGLDLVDDGHVGLTNDALETMKKTGIIITTPPSMKPFVDITKSVYTEQVPKMPPGSQKIIDEIRALAK